MESLIIYLNQKSKEAGHKLNMKELRQSIKTDVQEHNRISEDLRVLYNKTFEYEHMQRVLEDTLSMESSLVY
jgi:hypothetical protein